MNCPTILGSAVNVDVVHVASVVVLSLIRMHRQRPFHGYSILLFTKASSIVINLHPLRILPLAFSLQLATSVYTPLPEDRSSIAQDSQEAFIELTITKHGA